MVRILGKIGLSSFELDPETTEALQFEEPTKMGDDGKIIPLQRNYWTEAQKKAETAKLIAQNKMATEILTTMITHLGDAEREIYALLASVTETTNTEIMNMDAVEFIQMVSEFVNQEGFLDFFSQALNLLKKTKMS